MQIRQCGPLQGLHGWLGRCAPLVENLRRVARRRAHSTALQDGAKAVASRAQARRTLEELVHLAARSCRSSTARAAIDAQGKSRKAKRTKWATEGCVRGC